MEQRLDGIIEELEALAVENWAEGVFNPGLLHRAVATLKEVRQGFACDNRDDSDRGLNVDDAPKLIRVRSGKGIDFSAT